jgi:hypothetical protein
MTAISELKIAMFFSTRTSVRRGGTGLKTVFLSVCGNLQHIGQNLRFLKFFASVDERYDAKCRQNYQFSSPTNFRVTSMLGTKREGDETARGQTTCMGRNGKGTKLPAWDETARGRNDHKALIKAWFTLSKFL